MKNNNKKCTHVFKSSTKQRVGILCYFVLIFVIGRFFIKSIDQEIDAPHFVLFFVVSLWSFFIGLFVIYSGLDIVVSDDGVSKCFCGKRLQYIKWDEVKLIRKYTISDGAGNFSKAYNVCTDCEKCARFGLSGKIAFREDIKDSKVLINIINQYIVKYQIKVEMRDSLKGEFTSTNQL